MIDALIRPELRWLLPRRLSASAARSRWVRLLREVTADGLPVEIARRQRRSVFLVRAADFEAGLGPDHPWVGRRARLAPGKFRPNGLVPGVDHRWDHASSAWIRDHFGQVLEAVDETGEPLLVTRRGRCGLMLLARPRLEQSTVQSSAGRSGGKN